MAASRVFCNRALHEYLETNHFKTQFFWCNLWSVQERGLQFYQTRSNAVVLYDTLPAVFIEKAICMKTKEQLYQRPRVVLKANSQCGLQDLPRQEARSSWETQKRCTELPGNRMQHCGLQSPRHTLLNSSTAGGTKTTDSCQVDREV